jgi:hypothetical protein
MYFKPLFVVVILSCPAAIVTIKTKIVNVTVYLMHSSVTASGSLSYQLMMDAEKGQF